MISPRWNYVTALVTVCFYTAVMSSLEAATFNFVVEDVVEEEKEEAKGELKCEI